MEAKQLTFIDPVELANELESLAISTKARLDVFKDSESKIWNRHHSGEGVLIPDGLQRKILEAIAHEQFLLSDIVAWIHTTYGEASKSTIAQALPLMTEFIKERSRRTGVTLTEKGHKIAQALLQIDSACRSFAIGAVEGGHLKIKSIRDGLTAWDDHFQKLTAPAASTSRANPARIYDYLIGGGFNYVIDRETASNI